MKTKTLNFIYILIFSFLVFSCNNSVDGMITDYNSQFTIDYSSSITNDMLNPGDTGFSAKLMLRDEYFFPSDGTLTISAPPKACSWFWKVTDPENENAIVAIKIFGNNYYQYVVAGKSFTLSGSTCGLDIGKTYKLTLTVTDKEGLEYTDVCEIVVYKHYNN